MRIAKRIFGCVVLLITIASVARAETAEELYTRGRAIEDKTAGDAREAQSNLKDARELYVQALEAKPGAALEAYIRSGLANTSFFLDDYNKAIEEWTAAFPRLPEGELKAWALYRIGLSQQRLGKFEQADKTLARVQQEYKDSVPARRAKEKQGARSFYVQLAVFASTPTAEAAAAELRKQGMTPVMSNDSKGNRVMKLGPYATYTEARGVKGKMGEKYPDALIAP
jgi:tetratricopeptide (TPR) repeat protein